MPEPATIMATTNDSTLLWKRKYIRTALAMATHRVMILWTDVFMSSIIKQMLQPFNEPKTITKCQKTG